MRGNKNCSSELNPYINFIDMNQFFFLRIEAFPSYMSAHLLNTEVQMIQVRVGVIVVIDACVFQLGDIVLPVGPNVLDETSVVLGREGRIAHIRQAQAVLRRQGFDVLLKLEEGQEELVLAEHGPVRLSHVVTR